MLPLPAWPLELSGIDTDGTTSQTLEWDDATEMLWDDGIEIDWDS